jgi:hypothetical protein
MRTYEFTRTRELAERPNQRLLLPGRGRLSRRGLSLILVYGGFGTPRSRSAWR